MNNVWDKIRKRWEQNRLYQIADGVYEERKYRGEEPFYQFLLTDKKYFLTYDCTLEKDAAFYFIRKRKKINNIEQELVYFNLFIKQNKGEAWNNYIAAESYAYFLLHPRVEKDKIQWSCFEKQDITADLAQLLLMPEPIFKQKIQKFVGKKWITKRKLRAYQQDMIPYLSSQFVVPERAVQSLLQYY